MNSMGSLSFAINTEQYKIKKKNPYYFTGVIKAAFRNNSKTRGEKYFL